MIFASFAGGRYLSLAETVICPRLVLSVESRIRAIGIKEQAARSEDAHRNHRNAASSAVHPLAWAIDISCSSALAIIMAKCAWYGIVVVVIVVCGQAYSVLEDADRSVLGLNFPYSGELNNELQLARLLLTPRRSCYSKRNSELISSLLGLPKNMRSAGK